MYALVMWIGDEPTTSVVLLKDVEFTGKKTRAKWGPNYWPVQILRQSADNDWLQSLSAIANGQVIWSRPKNEQNGPASKKQKLNDDKNTNNVDKKSSRISENKEENPRPIIAESDKNNDNESKNSSDDESEKNDNDKMKDKSVDENRKIGSDDETVKVFSDEEMMKDDSDDSSSSSEFDDSNDTRSQKIHKVKPESLIGPFHCGFDSTILTPEIVNFFKDLAMQMEKMLVAKEVFSGTRCLHGMSELIPGSGVMISNSDLFEIKNTCTTKPKEMTRRLIRSIIDKKELKNMTLRGRGSRQAIPKNIFTAVETFVKENSVPNVQLTHAEYSRCLTQVCSNLRNTRLSTNESAKIKSDPLIEQYRHRLRSSSNKRDEETSKKSESSTERPKLAPRKRPTVSCEPTRKYKRIIQRKF